jgi:hypothetical protein
MSLAYRCEICEGHPRWEITRVGDVVVSWACGDHLAEVCEGLQRDWRATELMVTCRRPVAPEPVTAQPAIVAEPRWWKYRVA